MKNNDFAQLLVDLNRLQAVRAGLEVNEPIVNPERAIAALDDAECVWNGGLEDE